MLKFLKLTHATSYVFILTACLFLSYLLIPSWAFIPYTGLSLLFIFASSGVYQLHANKSVFTRFLFAVCLILSAFLILRANLFLTFLNLVGIMYAGSLHTLYGKMRYSITQILFSPLLLFLGLLKTKSLFDLPKTRFSLPEKYRKIDQHIPSIGLTVLLLLIIIPLLSYANPFFNALVTSIMNSLQHALSLEWLFKQNMLPYVLRAITFFILIIFIPRLFTIATFSHQALEEEMEKSQISYIIPKVTVALVLVVFFVTQMQLYTASASELLKIGYTNSQQTREIFAQLCIVVGIIFGLLYVDKNREQLLQKLSYILLLEAAFLNLIALKSVYDYSHTWGFTEKRLYGFSGIIWLFSALGFYFYYYLNQRSPSWLLKSIVGISTLVLIGINGANFDYLIYHYGKSTTHSGTDYVYMSSLSPDAMSYSDELQVVRTKLATEKNPNKYGQYLFSIYNITNKIDYITYKYTHPHIGSFNLSEYLTYLEIKHINTDTIRKEIQPKQQEYYNNPIPPSPSDQIVPINTGS